MSGFEAQPYQLQGSAPQYQDVSSQVADIYTTLTQKLDAEGACWGGDYAGRQFGVQYCPPALTTISSMDATNQGLQSIVSGICSWAKKFVDVEAMLADSAGSGGGGGG
jgi:uncharacterized protein YukE